VTNERIFNRVAPTWVSQLLRAGGPCLSSALARRLMTATGVTNDYARKLIQRSGSDVLVLEDIRFPRNEQFLFLQEHRNTSQFWRSLIEAFDSTGSVYGLAVNSLMARENIVPLTHFGIISGSPGRLKGHLSHDVVLKRLAKIGLFNIREYENFGPCVTFAESSIFDSGNIRSHRARAVGEKILLDALQDWARKLGLGSYGKVLLRGNPTQPQFGQFNWDLTAPTYLHPFVSHGKLTQPGFFVADVLLGKELQFSDVAYFLNKTTIMRRQRNTRPFLAMLVGNYFSHEVFQAAKTQGLIFVTPDTLFGNGISAALKELIQTLTNAAAAAVKNPNVIDELFSKLAKVEGAALNLRGPLFEMILGYCFRNEGSIDICVAVKDPETGEAAEVDVLVKGSTTVRACECKGYGTNDVDVPEVKDWLERQVPRIRKYFLSQDYFKKLPMTFEFWIAGKFTPAALEYLKARKQQVTKYAIEWKDGKDLSEYVGLRKESHVAKILNEQYFRHPLSGLVPAPDSTDKDVAHAVIA
jgi:hypothetical protein